MTNVVGERIARVDAQEQVSGQTIYTDDLQPPGLLYAQVLRSPFAHARITRIDTTAAAITPGVAAIITARDIPVNRWGFSKIDQPVLCDTKVRFQGDPVAAVAATSPQAATAALHRITVEYEPLPAIFDPIAAMEEGAPAIHGTSNIAARFKLRSGSIDEGWKQADEIIEETYRTQRFGHCALEPHVALAEIDSEGRFTVHTGSQRVFRVQADLSRVLQLPPERIRVISLGVGGGFGGKTEMSVEPLVCLLAQKTRRPVKLTYTRQEEFLASTIRHPYVIKIRSGVRGDGTLVARQVQLILDTGAYVQQGESVMAKAGIHAAGPYRIAHVKVDGYLVYTNTVVGGALRGFGVPQVAFAYESHTDTIARALGIDPLHFRLKNILRDNATLPTGQVLGQVALAETIAAAAQGAGWNIREQEEGSP